MNIFEQGLLRYLKPEQLAILQSQKVGLGGAGGLGSNCALMLVRSGFKNLEGVRAVVPVSTIADCEQVVGGDP